MQASTWTTTNRQCQQFGQLPSTHPSHFNQTTSSNDGSNAPCFFNSLSVDKMAASVGYFTNSSFGTKQVCTQRQDLRTADNQLPTSGHQGYYPNSTENASPLCTPNANMNTVFRQQVMYAQRTPGNPQSSVCFNNYEQQGMHQRSNQNLISQAENVTAQMNNSTSPTTSTVQAGYNNQTPAPSHIYNQQQVTYVQKTPGHPQSSVCLNNYEREGMHQSSNQNLKSQAENVTAQMNSSTFPTTSTVQAGYNTQTPAPSHIYNQQQVTYVQKTPGHPQSSVCLNNYEQQGMHQSSNQNLISHAENVTAQMNNSTSPTTSIVQAGYNTQTHVQSHIYNQCSQQKSHALPSYSQAVFAKNGYTGSSQVSSPQNVYTVNDQTNDCLPQTNYRQPGQAVNAHFPNNTNTLSNALTAVPVQRHDSYPNQELTQQPFINPNHNVSSMQLPSSTCSSENSNELLHLIQRPAPPQTVKNMPTKDPSASMQSMFYHKMNDVASVNLNAPQTQASQTNRYDTVAAQASSGTVQTSPCRAQRAIAVVLPLAQENSPDQPASPTDKTSPNTSSNPCFFGSNIMKDARLSTSEKSQQLTSSFSVSSEIASILNSSPSLYQMLKMADVAPKLSSLPLSFAQLVKRAPKKSPISGGCKQKLRKGKTPNETKPSEEPLSSVPTTEWTLKMLRDKIFEMESENKSDGMLTTTAGESGLFTLKTAFREIYMKVKLDTVVLSHVKSQNDLDKYTVLEHKEVYVDKIPYTSTWLNINSQLDDIDKEFGLPYFFKCTLFECDDKNDTDAHSEQTQTVQSQTESAKLKEPFTQNDQSDQGDLSADRKSNNIDEEVTASLQSETKNCDENQCESNEHSSDSSYSFKIEVLCPEEAKAVFEQVDHNLQKVEPPISEETVPNDQNVPKKQTCNATTLETICCIDKWKEKFLGLASEGKCNCKVLPNQNKEAQSRKTDDNSFSMEIFDLTEDHDISTSFLSAPGDTQEDSSSNSIIFLSESEDESMKVSEANQTPNSNSNNEQDLTKCTGSGLHEREVTTNETSCERKEPEEECRAGREETVAVVAEEKQEPLTSTPVSSRDGVQKHGKKTNMDTSDASFSHPAKKLKFTSHLRSQTLMESFSKCKNAAPGARVELAIFGSRKGKCSPTGSRRGNISLDRTYQAPQRIYVKMNSLTTSDTHSTESLSSSSVKRRIHENWRKSFPLPTIKIRKNNKNFVIVGGRSLKRKAVNLKRKADESDDSLCRKRRRTNNQSKSLTLLHKPKDAEFEQENVLKFNVLPSSFSFEEGSKNSESAMDPTADEITVAEKAKEKQVLKTQGTWCGDSRNKSPTQSPTSESSSLFQEYQRRHKMKQKSMDE